MFTSCKHNLSYLTLQFGLTSVLWLWVSDGLQPLLPSQPHPPCHPVQAKTPRTRVRTHPPIHPLQRMNNVDEVGCINNNKKSIDFLNAIQISATNARISLTGGSGSFRTPNDVCDLALVLVHNWTVGANLSLLRKGSEEV